MRSLAPFKSTVEIRRAAEHSSAHYGNLLVCGRLWQCPVCAATITEQRRLELTNALANTTLSPMLITYTLKHEKTDILAKMLPSALSAYRRLKSGRKWGDFTSEHFWVGSVRSLEVTHGDNGWHPHIHELALLDVPMSGAIESGVRTFVKTRWGEVLAKEGLNASWLHGADIRTANADIRDYVAKFGHQPSNAGWSIEHELTKAPSKKGWKGGRTPLQLLADYGQGDDRAGVLFKEYAAAFKGRNQLVWSRGLRESLGLSREQSDAELAENVPTNAAILASLSREDWRAVLQANARGHLLKAANEHGEIGIAEFMAAIHETLQEHQSA